MGARPYDSALGRFLAVAPVEGRSVNNYEYAGQDPVSRYDLTGACWNVLKKPRRDDLKRAGKNALGGLYLLTDGVVSFGAAAAIVYGCAQADIASGLTLTALVIAVCGPPAAAAATAGAIELKHSYDHFSDAIEIARMSHPVAKTARKPARKPGKRR